MYSSDADYKNISDFQYLVDVLLNENHYAEKILANGKIVNVLTKEIYEADIAIAGPYIVMIGDCFSVIGPKTEIIDVSGKYITPGFIDSHIHLEKSMLTLTEFAKLSIPAGTTCIISESDAIGNVLGCRGIHALCNEAELSPQHIFFRVPSLVPDTPGIETSGKDMSSRDLINLLNTPRVLGIGETRSISSIKRVYEHNREVIRDTICSSTFAKNRGYSVEGSAPEISGFELAAHIIAGGTDISCHETTTKSDAVKKLRNGIYLLIREGSTHQNINECGRAITEDKLDSRRVILATDDLLPEDLLTKGHMNHVIKKAIESGIDTITAFQMSTINPASWLHLSKIGIIAPGKYADVNIIRDDLNSLDIEKVFIKGKLVAENGKLTVPLRSFSYSQELKSTIQADCITEKDLMISSKKNSVTTRCIGLIKNKNVTDAIEIELDVQNNYVLPNLKEDILPIAVVGRYGQKTIGKSFVKGFNLKRGAIAQSISYNSHNIIVTGTNYKDMAYAVNQIIQLQGGMTAILNQECLGSIPLPVAGLMTDDLTAEELSEKLKTLHSIIKKQLGCSILTPFTHLAQLSLTITPKWKITDKGLIDISNQCIISTLKQ